MFKQGQHSYVFGPFRLDTTEKMLVRGEEPVPLTPKAFEILAVLVRRGGHLVDKDELLKSVWPDSFVEEGSLTQNIYVLRKALGEGPDEHRYIETVPRRGYRFVAEVTELREDARPPAIAEAPSSSTTPSVAEQSGERFGADDAGLPPPTVGETPAPPVEAVPDATPRRSTTARVAFALALALVLTSAAAVAYLRLSKSRTERAASGEPKVKSLAVLPFKSLSRREEDEALGLGMADAVIVRLGSLRQFNVLPASAVYKYTGREQDPVVAGRELGVDAVLTGAVQHSEGRVRVTAQLIGTGDGAALWSGVFDEKLRDIFAVQDSISEQLIAALDLQPPVEARARAAARRHTRNMEAYQLYLTGLYFWNKSTKDGFVKAAEYFQKAIEEDPDYALALGGLADTYVMLAVYKYDRSPPREIYGKARVAATRALELDDTVVEAHAAMSKVLAFYDKDYEGAERELRRAIALDPSHASARLRYAWLLLVMGRLEEGVREMESAQQLDPLSPITNITLGQFYVLAGRHDDAVRFGRRAVELDPDNSNAHLALGFAYEEKGMFAEAIKEYEAARDLEQSCGVTYGLESLGHAYAVAGRREEALQILASLQGPPNAANLNPYNVALIYAALDRKDAAFEWLERAAATDHLHPAFLRYDPQLGALKSDPRFRDLLRRHNLSIG